MGKAAIYPGTFDPLTFGHLEVIKRASSVFDKVIVAVTARPGKKVLFSLEERLNMVEHVCKDMANVSVESFEGLVIDYARQKKVKVLIRGLRMLSDFEYEFQMALTNRRLAADVETIFLMPSEEHAFVSSSLIKEAKNLGADISSFVPEYISQKLKQKLSAQ